MTPLPRLLETYEEARLLFEAKGWGLAKAAEHLSEMRDLARFRISHPKLSKKTTPGSKFPIEPEVAAAVEGMETRGGYERQTEIVTAGLRAAHGDPPIVDVDRLAAELKESLPANELALKLVEALEEKAGQRVAERSARELTPKLVEAVEALEEQAGQRAARFFQQLAERFGRLSWKQTVISAGSGALVALLLVPLLSAAHAFPAPADGPAMVLVFSPAGDDARRLDPRSLLDMPANWGEKPLDQTVPNWTLPGQKVAPCDAAWGEEAINGNCWAWQGAVKPPCGRLFRYGDKCYRPIAADPKKPVAPAP
jgi:hypothetical protein